MLRRRHSRIAKNQAPMVQAPRGVLHMSKCRTTTQPPTPTQTKPHNPAHADWAKLVSYHHHLPSQHHSTATIKPPWSPKCLRRQRRKGDLGCRLGRPRVPLLLLTRCYPWSTIGGVRRPAPHPQDTNHSTLTSGTGQHGQRNRRSLLSALLTNFITKRLVRASGSLINSLLLNQDIRYLLARFENLYTKDIYWMQPQFGIRINVSL